MTDRDISKLHAVQGALCDAESDCSDYFTLKRIREANEDIRELLGKYEG